MAKSHKAKLVEAARRGSKRKKSEVTKPMPVFASVGRTSMLLAYATNSGTFRTEWR